MAWGDFDNDGRLDLLITGNTGTNYVAKLYRNNSSRTNTPPAAPTDLKAALSNDAVTFSWSAASDPDQIGLVL